MCGIIGILGQKNVASALVDALKRLEYRGYDSAGIATLYNGEINRLRAPGKLRNLENKLADCELSGTLGIGHTRWATHGIPNEANAHPHMTDQLCLVHNGIIENFHVLREQLVSKGVTFESDTDTEVIAHLIAQELIIHKDPAEAVRHVLQKLDGAFAIAILFVGYDDLMIAARQGSPLAIGHGDEEMYVGSDAIALSPFTDKITYLEDGDWAVISRQSLTIYDKNGQSVKRNTKKSDVISYHVDKGNHRHFMSKEIHEQPEVVGHTLAHYIDFANNEIRVPDIPVDWQRLDRMVISACGTAYYAGLVAKYWFEQIAKISVDIDVASEFRYREAPLKPKGLSLFISQSGETADTLASLRYCKENSQHILSIVNVSESSIARESDTVLPTLAGPEIGVASTKAFTCQLTVLACLALSMAKLKGVLDRDQEIDMVKALVELPRLMSSILNNEHEYESLSQELSKARDVLYLGRGINFPLAMEGALKLKEISYIHAEGYPAGELKHGPIALIDENVPIIFVAPKDNLFDKTISNMQEVAARGGKIILLTDAKPDDINCELMARIGLPTAQSLINPILYAIPIQLLAYYTAVFMGTDVDQPRNLAKSVTVE
ncbi:MAG: glutamine--fructose-6-phosphate transaminase (isomerizing) [Pseudomonadota bacterium]